VEDVRRVAVLEAALQLRPLVQQLLEPELVDLVDDDEQQLVVLVGTRSLRGEHIIEREVRRVGERGLIVGHCPQT
jgi:hypothetical protein